MFLLSSLYTRFERSRMRKGLLKLDARQLADIGYSRELLEDGLRSYPWTMPAELAGSLRRMDWSLFAPRRPDAEVDGAVAALAGYSDAELRDLDVSRAGIEGAVRNGRPGYPETGKRAA